MQRMKFSPDHTILKLAMPVPLPGVFDYLPVAGEPLPRPGCRVVAPFGRRSLVGMVMGSAARSDLPIGKLQAVTECLDEGQPVLTGEMLDLLKWCAAYYKHPPGEVVFSGLPPELRRASGVLPKAEGEFVLTSAGRERLQQAPGRIRAQIRLLEQLSSGPMNRAAIRAAGSGGIRALDRVMAEGWVSEQASSMPALACREGPEPTAEQAAALADISAAGEGFACHLIDGVTGSGKTEIYLRLVESTLKRGDQALVLVPEIGLTPQLLDRFHDRLGIRPAVSHSGLSAGERMRTFVSALEGKARLVIGTRSALFLPMRRPGIIIMDESHDPSFKQQDGFRFSARDVAIKRAHDLQIPVLLGTATPSLETLHNTETGRYQRHVLRQRATGAQQPAWRVVDLRQQRTEGGFSQPALAAIDKTLSRGEQVLVFLNRRGYAPVLMCHDCGWNASCPRCDANMTWHQSAGILVCHHCESRQRLPRFCPDCRADALQGAGAGTEQLEEMLTGRFPGTPLHRVDRDRIRRKGEMEAMIGEVKGGKSCILVGTQMLAKGHHFPRVTLVVVVSLDQALYSADFRAMERMGQLLTQVAGRAGRDQDPGVVLLQTHHPDHPSLVTLLGSGYGAFARDLLAERRMACLPPYAFQAVLRAEATERDKVLALLNRAAEIRVSEKTGIHGPFPAMMERRAGRMRWYLLLQSQNRAALQADLNAWLPELRQLKESRSVRWTIDVDPQEF
jgi:primosomal protein N' (replication factor Y)